MTKPIAIVASAYAEFSRDMTNADIRKLVKAETGLSVRRLDNFTLTAMNAVYRLLHGREDINGLIGLYSSAEYFSLELLQSIITSQSNGEPVRPLDFIATVGNAANFYLAKEFQLLGPNNFIGASENALEKSIWLTKCDFDLDLVSHAVVVIWHDTIEKRVCNAYLLNKTNNTQQALNLKGIEDSLNTMESNIYPYTINWI